MNCETYKKLYAKYTKLPLSKKVFSSEKYSEWVSHINDCEACGDWYMAQMVEKKGGCVEDFPCVHLAYYSLLDCPDHTDPWDCPDVLVVKLRNGFGLPIRDGGCSYVRITHCPWCGKPLA
jgi:hypothetical protein